MEGMVTDLQLAREKQREFEDWMKKVGKGVGIDMGVQVLTTGFWPTYKVQHCLISMFRQLGTF